MPVAPCPLYLENPLPGIDSSIFINPLTFHLTVQMLKLWSIDRVMQACLVLQVRRNPAMQGLHSAEQQPIIGSAKEHCAHVSAVGYQHCPLDGMHVTYDALAPSVRVGFSSMLTRKQPMSIVHNRVIEIPLTPASKLLVLNNRAYAGDWFRLTRTFGRLCLRHMTLMIHIMACCGFRFRRITEGILVVPVFLSMLSMNICPSASPHPLVPPAALCSSPLLVPWQSLKPKVEELLQQQPLAIRLLGLVSVQCVVCCLVARLWCAFLGWSVRMAC